MKFICDQCQTKYSIDDARVHGKVLKIRCKQCNHVITVREETAARPAVATPAPTGRGLERALGEAFGAEAFGGDKTQVSDGSAVAALLAQTAPRPAEEWFVSADGDQEGPFTVDKAALRAKVLLTAGKETFGWRDGFERWLPVLEIPEFARTLRPPALPRLAPVPTVNRVASPIAKPVPRAVEPESVNAVLEPAPRAIKGPELKPVAKVEAKEPERPRIERPAIPTPETPAKSPSKAPARPEPIEAKAPPLSVEPKGVPGQAPPLPLDGKAKVPPLPADLKARLPPVDVEAKPAAVEGKVEAKPAAVEGKVEAKPVAVEGKVETELKAAPIAEPAAAKPGDGGKGQASTGERKAPPLPKGAKEESKSKLPTPEIPKPKEGKPAALPATAKPEPVLLFPESKGDADLVISEPSVVMALPKAPPPIETGPAPTPVVIISGPAPKHAGTWVKWALGGGALIILGLVGAIGYLLSTRNQPSPGPTPAPVAEGRKLDDRPAAVLEPVAPVGVGAGSPQVD